VIRDPPSAASRTSPERRRRRSVKRLVNTTTTPPSAPPSSGRFSETLSARTRARTSGSAADWLLFSLSSLSLSTFIHYILFFSSRFPRSETIGNYIGTIPPPPPPPLPPPPPPHSFLLQLPIRTHRTHIFTFITYIITIMFIPVHPVSR